MIKINMLLKTIFETTEGSINYIIFTDMSEFK